MFKKVLKIFKNEAFCPLKSIKPLKNPIEFKNTLIKYLNESINVYLLCLYMGTGEEIIEIFKILRERKKQNKNTKIILDYNRAKRTSIIFKLIDDFGLKEIVFFCDPSYSIYFNKIKELFCVLHSKVFIFDDKVLLTGANLEDTYLTNRIDRYLLVEGNEFINELLYLFDNFCHRNFDLCFNKYKIKGKDTISFVYSQRKEEEIFEKIFSLSFDEIYMSTGYLNFPDKYLKLLKNKKIKIIVPSPETSTYSQVNLFHRNVVESYNISTIKTKEILKKADIYEYAGRESFHAKGIWCFKKNLCLTIVGSSNFNIRSTKWDIETNFLILTNHKENILKFRKEIGLLVKNSKLKTLKELKERKISWFTRYFYFFHVTFCK